MKFLKGFLVFILIAVIIGGIGYIGYTYLFMGGMNHLGNTTTASQTQQPADTNANANTSQNQQGMQHGNGNTQTQQNSNTQQNNSTQQGNNQIALNQSNLILQNKEKLEKAIAAIHESSRLMSVDPYAPSSSNTGSMSGMANMQPQQNIAPAQPVQPTQGNLPAITNPGNNTIINVFPQGNGQSAPVNTTQPNSVMQNMGTTYDPNKMEQLHAGLYKIAVGKALLGQLQIELVYQSESAAGNIQNPVQYYTNQYNQIVQNKSKLSQALTYVNEAANLVNINPYVSPNGLVYDKDRMNQIHQSILKLAEGVASLNLLGDDFNRQAISLSNIVQNYYNNTNVNTNNTIPMDMPTGLFGGLFDNISMSSVINIILIIFAIGLIAGIFGFIANLLKPPNQKAVNRDNELI